MASLKRLAPNVLVSIRSVPAATYSRWIAWTVFAIVEVQHVEAGVQRHAARVEHGAHGAVGEQRALLEPLDERAGAGLASHGAAPRRRPG